MNRLLRNSDRERYKGLIEGMIELIPEIMAKKYPLANVQQAWTLEMIKSELEKKSGASILCVGSFEDSSSAYLEKFNIPATNIDPDINVDLHTFLLSTKDTFDIIFSTSVIEHVEDDELFIKDICKLLTPDGIAILTCDFNNDYKIGDEVIYPDFRFYTEEDLNIRLRRIIEEYNCTLVGDVDWSGEPDFHLVGFDYSFATLMFRKSK